MKKGYFLYIILLAMLSTIFFSNRVSAVGIGLYGSYNYTEFNYSFDYLPKTELREGDGIRNTYGFGFVLDTFVAHDELLSHRIGFGVSFGKMTLEDNSFSEDVSQINYNLFYMAGFGIFRNEIMRLWIGPRMDFGYSTGEFSTYYNNDEYNEFSFGLGLFAGINFHVSESISIGIECGYSWTYINGWDESQDIPLISDFSKHNIISAITIFYRMGDEYYTSD